MSLIQYFNYCLFLLDLRPIHYWGWLTASPFRVALLAYPIPVSDGCTPSQERLTSATASSGSPRLARPSVNYIAEDPYAFHMEEGPRFEETRAEAAREVATFDVSQVQTVYEGVSFCATPSPPISRAATAAEGSARAMAIVFAGIGNVHPRDNAGIGASDPHFESVHQDYFEGYKWTSHEARAAEDSLTEGQHFGGLHMVLSAVTNIVFSPISEGSVGVETLAGAEPEVNAASAWALLVGGISLLHVPLTAM